VIRVLVVEDEADIRRLIEMKLRVSGFEVLTAVDGAEGLAMAIAEKPDIMLCDVMMPKKDGYAVVSEVRAELGDQAPVILMLTARGQQADLREGIASGADDYIVKPFVPRDLISRIRVAVLRSGKPIELPPSREG